MRSTSRASSPSNSRLAIRSLRRRIANAVAENYLSFQQVAKQDQARAASQWLSGELEKLRVKVSEADFVKRVTNKYAADDLVYPAKSPRSGEIIAEAGQQITVEWRGKPVWVLRRTPEMLAQLDKNAALLADPESKSAKQPTYVKGVARSIKPEIFVAVGICTHLGCSPTLKKEVGAASDMGGDWPGGYYCPCHNSRFDLAARVFKGDLEQFGDAKEFPFVATTYRLTEHFHFWTKHNKVNAVMQPEFFVEISEELAREKGIQKGGWVRVDSNRGYVKAKAVVTKRIKPMKCDGKTVHIVGIPIHWGFTGATKKGFGANALTPYVGDANIETPEFKAFLVDIKPDSGPAVS